MKNKLLVLKSKINNSVIAITEFKYHMKLFILQNEYDKKDYILKEYTDISKVNKYLIQYSEDYYLIEYKNFIIRNSDKKYIDELIYLSKNNIKETINNLDYINSNYILSPKEHIEISNNINILNNNIKKKNIDEFINIHYLIKNLCNNHNMKYDLQELNNNYQYNLLKGD